MESVSAVDWLTEGRQQCTSPCEEHELFFKSLSLIATKSAAFETEMLSHLSALQEIARREQVGRDIRAHKILDQLASIEAKVGHVTNGGLKDAMMDLVPVILNARGNMQVESIKGRAKIITAAISGAAAVGGALIGWLLR